MGSGLSSQGVGVRRMEWRYGLWALVSGVGVRRMGWRLEDGGTEMNNRKKKKKRGKSRVQEIKIE